MTQRILLVQLADIGDLILSTPAIAALREAQPNAHLTLLAAAHSSAVIADTTLVNQVITIERHLFNSSRAFFKSAALRQLWRLRTGGIYDVVVFFHHFTLRAGTLKFGLIARASGARQRVGLQNGNGWFLTHSIPDEGFGARHQAQYWLDLVGLLGAATTPRPAQVNMATTLRTDLLPAVSSQRPLIVLHPGSGGYSKARRWDAAQFALVADRLHREHGATIVLVGTPEDGAAAVRAAMQGAAIDLTGKTTLAQLAYVLRQSTLFIGADSGIMHLAAAAGTPVVAIFGPSNHAAWGPWTPEGSSVVLRSAPECSPCSYVAGSIGLREGCAARTCMRLVTPEQVFAAAEALLQNRTPPQPPAEPDSTRWHKRIQVLGLPVDAITYDQWLGLIEQWVAARRAGLPNAMRVRHVCTTNPEFMIMAQHDTNFRSILKRADLCVPDGIGLIYAARWLRMPLPGRVTGSDGVPRIAERAIQTGWRLFFLGAAPGVAEQAAAVLRARYPGLQIAGTHSGSPAANEEDALVALVNTSGADLLFVAYGAPEQDKWIARNLPRLQVAMAMGVGGTFDFIAGVVPRAPLWMRRAGLEWLFRLIRQPWRLKRMLRLPQFVLAVLRRGAR